MEDKYSIALKEVHVVLENSEDSIKEKIPDNFKSFIEKNMEKDYIPNIDFNDRYWNHNIMEETKQILAAIYRDYLVSETERKLLLEEETIQDSLREKYNTNIFEQKDSKIESLENRENKKNLQLTTKETIFFKIINKIKSIFKK